MNNIFSLTIMLTVLSSSIVYANDITIIRPGMDKVDENHTHPNIIEIRPSKEQSPILDSYPIGDYKGPNGVITKNCYAKILRSSDGLTIGTSIYCVGDQQDKILN